MILAMTANTFASVFLVCLTAVLPAAVPGVAVAAETGEPQPIVAPTGPVTPIVPAATPAGALPLAPQRPSGPPLVSGATHRINVHGMLSFEKADVSPSGGCNAVQVRVFRRTGGEVVSTVRAVGSGKQCSYALSFPHPTRNLSELDIDATPALVDGVRVEWSKSLTGWSDKSDTKTVNFVAHRVAPEPKPNQITSTKPNPSTNPSPGPSTAPDLAITHENTEDLGPDMLMLRFRIKNAGSVSVGVQLETLIGKPCAAMQGAKGDWGHLEFITLPAPIIPGGSLFVGYQLDRYVGRGCTVRAVLSPFKNGKPVADADTANNTVEVPTPKEQRADLVLDTHSNGGQLFFSIKNSGDAPSTPTKLVYDCVGDKDACKPAPHLERSVPALAPGAWYLSDIAVDWHPKGWHWTAVVDPDNTVKEWNDSDNNRAQSK
jgi:hypothetical protein